MSGSGFLGRYELRRTLGRGSAGVVYEGWDSGIARKLAIKTVRLPSGDDAEASESLERFRREARAAGRLNHPNIVGIFDYGETNELAYIVMEYIDGETLQAALDRGKPFELHEIVRLAKGMLLGLGYSHSRGVIHRDIKPANLMLTREGDLKIADFGIARLESSTATQVGTIMGTPAYMSPEQILGQEVDARADLYSAGVVLYLLLTGQKPFESKSMTATMQRALHEPAMPPSRISVRAPPAFDAVVMRAMAKKPEERFETAAAFSAALTAAAEALSRQEPGEPERTVVQRSVPVAPFASPSTTARRLEARSKVPLLTGAGIATALLAAAGTWWLLSPSASRPTVPESSSPVAEPPPIPALPFPPPPKPAATEPSPLPTAVTAAPETETGQPLPEAAKPAAIAATSSAPRRDLDAALARAACSLLSASDQPDGRVLVSGLVGEGASLATLQRTIADAMLKPPARLDVRTVPTPLGAGYCRVLAVAHPQAGEAGGSVPVITFSGDRDHLLRDDPISIAVTMPDFPGELLIDYVTSDGNTYHVPQDRTPRQRAAGETVRPGNNGVIGTVGAPFGTDLILVTASSGPLFPKPRAGQIEKTVAYLLDLQAAIEAARGQGRRVTAAVAPLDTANR